MIKKSSTQLQKKDMKSQASNKVKLTPQRKRARKKLSLAKGQLEGIIRMIDDERYCIDISTQLLAVMGMIKSANIDILKGHAISCVSSSFAQSTTAGEEKLNEIMEIISKQIK